MKKTNSKFSDCLRLIIAGELCGVFPLGIVGFLVGYFFLDLEDAFNIFLSVLITGLIYPLVILFVMAVEPIMSFIIDDWGNE